MEATCHASAPSLKTECFTFPKTLGKDAHLENTASAGPVTACWRVGTVNNEITSLNIANLAFCFPFPITSMYLVFGHCFLPPTQPPWFLPLRVQCSVRLSLIMSQRNIPGLRKEVGGRRWNLLSWNPAICMGRKQSCAPPTDSSTSMVGSSLPRASPLP